MVDLNNPTEVKSLLVLIQAQTKMDYAEDLIFEEESIGIEKILEKSSIKQRKNKPKTLWICPECRSADKINTYRMLTGPIWCSGCGFRVEQKEINNPFVHYLKDYTNDPIEIAKNVDLELTESEAFSLNLPENSCVYIYKTFNYKSASQVSGSLLQAWKVGKSIVNKIVRNRS